jgi:hypothetical protein
MEPFVTRDGRNLYFNNANNPGVDTNLFRAERVDDLAFQFRGEVQGANSSDLNAVASMDRAGHFYFVSSRDYLLHGALIQGGRFSEGRVTGVHIVEGLSSWMHRGFNFDAEISADGYRP